MNKDRRNILLTFAAVVLVGVLWYVFSLSSSTADDNTPQLSDHIKGSTSAVVTLVEFSDFQCPACGAYYPVVKQITEEYGDKIKLTYKHFPLRKIHQNAEIAARAAEAAGMQGKFWEMHDMIFENQKQWSEGNARDIFIGYAKTLGLDVKKFTKDLYSKAVRQKVQQDFNDGVARGVNYTPYFLINGERIDNPRGYDEFKKVIEQALSSVEGGGSGPTADARN